MGVLMDTNVLIDYLATRAGYYEKSSASNGLFAVMGEPKRGSKVR